MASSKKILVYGFGPFGGYPENITQKIIDKLKRRKLLVKIIFPAVFDGKIFLRAVARHKPDLILGLGQCPRGSRIRIERRCVNQKKELANDKIRKIIPGGPSHRSVNFKLGNDVSSRLSYDAGNFVCNFSMYVLSDYATKNVIDFAFLHVPRDHDVCDAVNFAESKIDEMMGAE
jgi:pyrrolidone-carboxylate peptidase